MMIMKVNFMSDVPGGGGVAPAGQSSGGGQPCSGSTLKAHMIPNLSKTCP